jgi:hypothetical protein
MSKLTVLSLLSRYRTQLTVAAPRSPVCGIFVHGMSAETPRRGGKRPLGYGPLRLNGAAEANSRQRPGGGTVSPTVASVLADRGPCR